MSIFNRVTLQSLKENKTRTLVTIIGIILSAAMICAVTTFASSFLNYARETTIYTEGNWHGYQHNTSYQTYLDVVDTGETEETVYLQQIGYAYAQGCENEFKPYIYVLGAGEGVENVLPIHITSGRYPASREEILLPNHLYTNGGVKYSLGDQLTLKLGSRVLDGFPLYQETPCYVYEQGDEVHNGEVLEPVKTRSYTVVGFYDRLSMRIESHISPGYTAITLADEKIDPESAYDVYFRMKQPKEIYGFMRQMGLDGDCNTDLLMYAGTFAADSFSRVLYGLVVIVILLIMFGSVALIYNAFSISVSERTKQFGLLASIGATKRQLRSMVLFEACAVSIIGIPLGILAGVSGIGVTLLLIGDKFRSMGFPIDMKLSVSPAAILIAVAVALITVLISAWIPSSRATKVSAVAAIRQNMDVKNTKPVKTSRLTYKVFGLPGALANKHYKRNRKKYRATVLSLFMSITLFVSASAFTDYLMETVAVGFGSYNYDLAVSVAGDGHEEITPQELLERMRAAKGVTGAAFTQERYVKLQVRQEHLTPQVKEILGNHQQNTQDSSLWDMYSYITFVDNDTFRALLKQNGLPEAEYMDAAHPKAVVLDGNMQFNLVSQKYEKIQFFPRGHFSMTLQREREIPGYYHAGEILNEENQPVVIYVKDRAHEVEGPEELHLSPEEAYVSSDLNIGQVIREAPFFVRQSDGIRIIYPFSFAEKVFGDFKPGEHNYFYKLTSRNHKESEAELQTILNSNGLDGKAVQNIAEMEESERNIITIVRVFSYGFIVLISLIAAANVFNTISTNISLRRREFAMLKSVGMSQKDFNRMMNYECLLYGSRALLYGLPAACGVTYLIYRAILQGVETAFQLPWTAIGIAVLSVFLVVFATMMYAMGKIKKEDPIHALKTENL